MTAEETLAVEALVRFALDPDRKAQAPKALQTVAGGKRRAATTVARRDARPPDQRTKPIPPGGAEEGLAERVLVDTIAHGRL